MSFALIKKIDTLREETLKTNAIVLENLAVIAEEEHQEQQILAENVTHVLANIAQTAKAGDELKLMHLNSVAAFLAGVETMATTLPAQRDDTKRQNSLRALAAAGVDPEGHVTYATSAIAQLGTRNEERFDYYRQLVANYAQSVSRGQPDGQALATTAGQLQGKIDQAMRSAATNKGGTANAPGDTSKDPSIAAAQPGVM